MFPEESFGVANPVEVFTKSAPERIAHWQQVTIVVSARKQVSRITFTVTVFPVFAPASLAALTTPAISSCMELNLHSAASPALNRR